MDDVDAVPRPRRQRPKDSFQNELQSKLRQRKSRGLSSEITDSDDDGLGSMNNSGYQPKRPARPGSAKYRTDKSPDLSHGLGTTTMRAKDLTHLLSHNGGHSDDDDEEVMAATLGKSKGGGSWQPPSYKTPSPKQDSKLMRRTPTSGSPKDQSHLDSLYGRKTPSRDSPKEQSSRLDSIFGRKTPTGESPKDQSRLESLYGRKTPTKDSPKEQSRLDSLYDRKTTSKDSLKDKGKSDLYDRKTSGKDRTSPGLSKEEMIFGRKTPTSEGRWQPPSFKNVSPSSSPDHSRGSRGVTPTESLLDPISETPRDKVTPRLQRGERLRNDDSPSRQVSFGERPKPQARSKIGERRTSPGLDSPPALRASNMKRATPTMDLFGKTRSEAAQEVENFMDSDRKGQYGKDGKRTPDNVRTSLRDKERNKPSQKQEQRRSGSREKSPGLRLGSRSPDGRKGFTSQKANLDRKSPFDKKMEDEQKRKQNSNQNSSLLDFLTGGNETKGKPQEKRKERTLRTANDDIDDMFSANHKPTQRSYNSSERRSPDQLTKRPSLLGHASPEGRKETSFREEHKENREEYEREKRKEYDREKRKEKNEDASSVCEEIPLDPHAKFAKAEEKSMKSGKQRTERTRADNIIDTISEAQTMMYIEPAKKVRPVTAEAKVQHRPKPRYSTLPGSATQTLSEREFNSTSDIRDAIYEEWYAERIKLAKKKKKEEEKKKKEEEDKKNQEEEEKQREAMLSYKSWTEKKKETFDKDQAKKRRREEAKKEKENEEREEKREASKKLFEHWKNDKDARNRQELRKKKEKEEEDKRVKEDEEYKKRKDKETAFRGWKQRKEQDLKRQQREMKENKKTLKLKKEQEEDDKQRNEEDALQKYNDWLDAKEKQKHYEKRRTNHFEMDEDKPAWSPASRIIPFGR